MIMAILLVYLFCKTKMFEFLNDYGNTFGMIISFVRPKCLNFGMIMAILLVYLFCKTKMFEFLNDYGNTFGISLL